MLPFSRERQDLGRLGDTLQDAQVVRGVAGMPTSAVLLSPICTLNLYAQEE